MWKEKKKERTKKDNGREENGNKREDKKGTKEDNGREENGSERKEEKKEGKKGEFFWSLKKGWVSEKKNKITHFNVWFGLG